MKFYKNLKMNNENDEENIKLFFLEKINKDKTSKTYLTRKIFEEYVKFKNAVNIYIQNNKLTPKNIINKKQEININNYNNIKYWIKMIIISNEINDLSTKKSYSYVNINSKQIAKPLGDLNFPYLYSSKNIKNLKNAKKSLIYSTANNIFQNENLQPGSLEDEKNEEEYTDEVIIEKLKNCYDNDKDLLLKNLQHGPPESFRLITWNIVNNISYLNNLNFIINNINYNSNEIYKLFLLKDLEKSKSDLIYRDIKRTFPLQNYNSINKTKKQLDEACLFNVLKSFWNIDEEIGYCQGMNYITGFLLINTDFNEKKAFFLLISIFSNTFFKRKKNFFSLRGLFIEEFPLLYFYIFIFDDLLSKHIPKLRKLLLDNDITNDVWIIKWFQTAFTVILPIKWSQKLWDNIFSSDFFFIIKFSISLCSAISKDLIQLSEQQLIMDYFRNIQTVPLSYKNPFLEKKFDIDNLLNDARKIKIDIDEYIAKYELESSKGKDFKEKIYKINNIKYFDINYEIKIKKTITTVKARENIKSTNNNIFDNINDLSGIVKNESNKILRLPKNSFGHKNSPSEINNIKLNTNKKLHPKYKLIKKTENPIINKTELNKKLILKNKFSNSNIHNNNNILNNNNKNNESMKVKNQSSRIINNIKNKGITNSSKENKKEKNVIQNKTLNSAKIVNTSNLNPESMNTVANKNNYQKILYIRKKNMAIIPKRNGFSSSNVKQMNNKNNNKTEISDIFNSSKKNLSKEMNKHNNNSKDNEIKVKNTFKNKIMSISILNGNKNNFDNSRNNLVNELKRRKQYLNKQIKYFSTNDSSKFSNSFLYSEKKKIINSNSNSNKKIKESENKKKKININNDNKPVRHIKIQI